LGGEGGSTFAYGETRQTSANAKRRSKPPCRKGTSPETGTLPTGTKKRARAGCSKRQPYPEATKAINCKADRQGIGAAFPDPPPN